MSRRPDRHHPHVRRIRQQAAVEGKLAGFIREHRCLRTALRVPAVLVVVRHDLQDRHLRCSQARPVIGFQIRGRIAGDGLEVAFDQMRHGGRGQARINHADTLHVALGIGLELRRRHAFDLSAHAFGRGAALPGIHVLHAGKDRQSVHRHHPAQQCRMLSGKTQRQRAADAVAHQHRLVQAARGDQCVQRGVGAVQQGAGGGIGRRRRQPVEAGQGHRIYLVRPLQMTDDAGPGPWPGLQPRHQDHGPAVISEPLHLQGADGERLMRRRQRHQPGIRRHGDIGGPAALRHRDRGRGRRCGMQQRRAARRPGHGPGQPGAQQTHQGKGAHGDALRMSSDLDTEDKHRGATCQASFTCRAARWLGARRSKKAGSRGPETG